VKARGVPRVALMNRLLVEDKVQTIMSYLMGLKKLMILCSHRLAVPVSYDGEGVFQDL
jgi:hypothetical protein